MSGGESSPDGSGSLELAILGSGSAFSAIGHNAGYLVGGELLLDCGAPVTRLLGQMERPLDQLRAVLISHLHSDHFFHLPQLLAARTIRFKEAEPLSIVGPPGTGEQLDTLGRLALGDRFWGEIKELGGATVEEWGDGKEQEVAGWRVRAVEVEHSPHLTCLGFRLSRPGISLGYSGDTVLCPGIRELAASVDYLLIECTSMSGPVPIHLWRGEVEDLIQANSRTHFILTHLLERAPVPGAILASDGLVLQLTPIAQD